MRFPLISTACVLALALAACAPTTSDSGSGSGTSPSPAASAAASSGPAAAQASVEPSASPTPAPSASPAVAPTPKEALPAAATLPPPPSPVITVSPSPSPAPAPTTKPTELLPPNAAPQILAISLDKSVVHAGDTVSGSVETSSNVASVEARIAGFSISVPKVAEGKFALAYTVPNLPFFLHKTYSMRVIARNTAGTATSRTVPITIR